MDAEITLEEVTAAVKSLKHNKTCGMDGCPAEMLQFFWSKWGTLYYNALQYAFRVGKLHLSARRGVIILIQKGQKDPMLMIRHSCIALYLKMFISMKRCTVHKCKYVFSYFLTLRDLYPNKDWQSSLFASVVFSTSSNLYTHHN